MIRYHGLAALLLVGLFAATAHAEPPKHGPTPGAAIVPLKAGHVSGSMCWSCFG